MIEDLFDQLNNSFYDNMSPLELVQMVAASIALSVILFLLAQSALDKIANKSLFTSKEIDEGTYVKRNIEANKALVVQLLVAVLILGLMMIGILAAFTPQFVRPETRHYSVIASLFALVMIAAAVAIPLYTLRSRFYMDRAIKRYTDATRYGRRKDDIR